MDPASHRSRRWTRLLLVALACLSLGFEWEGRLGRLQRQLENGDARQRREVVRLMASYPASEVREPLLRALEDSDAAVRSEAAETAGRVRLGEAVPVLLEWLEDEDADVRAAAARAVGRIGDARSIPGLVRALGDASSDVRRHAVVALGDQEDASVVVPLLGRLDDDDGEVRVEAANVLARLGDDRAVVPLVGRARDESPAVRQAVYTALGSLGDQRASAALIQSLRDEAEPARLAAIAALGRLGAERGIDPLTEMLQDRDPRTPRAAVSALAAIGSNAALAAVVDSMAMSTLRQTSGTILATHDSDAVTGLLASALRATRDPAHAAAIGGVLDSRLRSRADPSVADSISRALDAGRAPAEILLPALARTGNAEVLVTLLEHLGGSEATRRAALTALDHYFSIHPADGRAADPLLAVLGDVPPADRILVVRLLGKVGASRALPVIRPLLTHSDSGLQLAAVDAIGAIGDPIGAEALLELLDSQQPRVRFEAARALGDASSPQVVAALAARLVSREPVDRHAVLIALGGGLARVELAEVDAARLEGVFRRLLASPDRGLTARVVDTLRRWTDPRAVPVLRLAISRGHTSAMLSLNDPEALRGAFANGTMPARVTAAAALGKYGDAADVTRLATSVQRDAWPLPAASSFGLALLAAREVPMDAAVLCPLLARRDAHVRANVIIALTRVGAVCPERHPESFLERAHAPVVRAAAARWMAAVGASAATRDALARCAEEELAPEVARACAEPALSADTQDADVYAYAFDRQNLLREQLVALRFADGSALITHTDANAHVRWSDAPAGRIMLDDPLRTPLQP